MPTSSSSAGAARRRPTGTAATTPFSSTIEEVVRDAPCDIAVVKQRGAREIRRVMVPVRGGPHAELALRFADAIARRHDADLVALHVVPPGITIAVRAQAERALAAFVRQHATARVETVVREAANVRNAILREADRADIVIMGARRRADLRGRLAEPLRGDAGGDRDALEVDGRRRQDARGRSAAGRSSSWRPARRPSPRPTGPRRRPAPSRPASSAGSANRTSTTASSPTCAAS